MTTLYLILFIVAFVLLVLAALGVSGRGRAARVNLAALGLAVWVLVPLIQTANHLSK